MCTGWRHQCFYPFLFMKKIIYIIPGLGEHCDLVRYKMLAKAIEDKGYKVNRINPDWYRPLSEQVFPIGKSTVVIGFSFGAILAYLIVKKHPCKKVIFASISPLHEFSFDSLVKDFREHMLESLAVEITTDIKCIKVSLKDIKTPFVTLAGKLEKMNADILVPSTGHKITPAYIKCIVSLL